MLLQSRGRMTAPTLASELEVSVRTIYRDMEALGVAGVPVYADRGREGGFSLLERYRSDLTGLTPEEVKALFSLAAPSALDQLGMKGEVQAALLKLAASLPEQLRETEGEVRGRIHVDPSPWTGGTEPAPHLQAVHRAVWDDRQLEVEFAWQPHIRVNRTVDPLGLVAKEGDWYLVWNSEAQIGVYRVDRLANVETLPTTFERPPDFDLAKYWRQWRDKAGSGAASYEVRLRINAELEPHIQHALGVVFEPLDPNGLTGIVRFESLESARKAVLPLGGAVEVIEPEALRRSVGDFAKQTTAVYEKLSAFRSPREAPTLAASEY
jgi:predicted DNA-binding transcriptional regulator YafY